MIYNTNLDYAKGRDEATHVSAKVRGTASRHLRQRQRFLVDGARRLRTDDLVAQPADMIGLLGAGRKRP
jgi:hypothetical protein